MIHRVARSERALLQVTEAVVGLIEPVQALPSLGSKAPEGGRKIGPTAMALLQSTLRRGVVRALAHANGGRQSRSLHDPPAAAQPPWQAPPELTFTERSFELLCWLAWSPAASIHQSGHPASDGDQVLEYLASCLLDRLDRPLPKAFQDNALCWLAVPHRMPRGAQPAEANWTRWLSGQGATLLTALQPRLAKELVRIERRKAATKAVGSMLLYRGHREALDHYLTAADASGRRDLAQCVVEAGAKVLAPRPSPDWWIGQLAFSGTQLADRQEAFKAAASLLSAVARVGGWQKEHGLTRFFDEQYDAAQLLLAQWESFGHAGFELASERLRALDGLHLLEG